MRKWLLIIGAGAVVGYTGVYFALARKPAPAPEPVPAVAVQPQPEPVVLAQVVDVTDLDPLLDPLPGQPAGLPFESDPFPPTVTVGTAPTATIPPADE